jgi:hypothetical protein
MMLQTYIISHQNHKYWFCFTKMRHISDTYGKNICEINLCKGTNIWSSVFIICVRYYMPWTSVNWAISYMELLLFRFRALHHSISQNECCFCHQDENACFVKPAAWFSTIQSCPFSVNLDSRHLASISGVPSHFETNKADVLPSKFWGRCRVYFALLFAKAILFLERIERWRTGAGS